MTDQSDTEKAAEEWAKSYAYMMPNTNLCKERVLAAQEEGFLAGAAWAEPKWIKCSERLPEALETVLVMLAGIAIPCYGYRLGSVISHWAVCDDVGELDNYRDSAVTHWMPLPAAPKEEK